MCQTKGICVNCDLADGSVVRFLCATPDVPIRHIDAISLASVDVTDARVAASLVNAGSICRFAARKYGHHAGIHTAELLPMSRDDHGPI